MGLIRDGDKGEGGRGEGGYIPIATLYRQNDSCVKCSVSDYRWAAMRCIIMFH